jgi:hypothetical protein
MNKDKGDELGRINMVGGVYWGGGG